MKVKGVDSEEFRNWGKERRTAKKLARARQRRASARKYTYEQDRVGQRERENGRFSGHALSDIFLQGNARSGRRWGFVTVRNWFSLFDSSPVRLTQGCNRALCVQVHEEIESNIQITRQLESEILRCSEVEAALSAREAELMKLLYTSHFELNGLMAVTSKAFLEFSPDEYYWLARCPLGNLRILRLTWSCDVSLVLVHCENISWFEAQFKRSVSKPKAKDFRFLFHLFLYNGLRIWWINL